MKKGATVVFRNRKTEECGQSGAAGCETPPTLLLMRGGAGELDEQSLVGHPRQVSESGKMSNDIEKVRRLTSENDDQLSDGECELLYELAKGVPSGQAIVEIGRGNGKSTLWLAKGTEAGQRNKVYSIAPYAGSNAPASESERSAYAAFLNKVKESEVQDTVVPLVTTSDEAAKHWREVKVGLLFIDATREYEDVKHALLAWDWHLSPRAKVALHGCDQPGPARAMKEALGDCGNLKFVEAVDTTVVVSTDTCIHYWIMDSGDIGVCRYCGRERNFKRLLRESLSLKESGLSSG